MTSWLPTLVTKTPEEGYSLAITLSRMAVKATQPDEAARQTLRLRYEHDAQALIAISHTVAVNFATIAAANSFWTGREGAGRT